MAEEKEDTYEEEDEEEQDGSGEEETLDPVAKVDNPVLALVVSNVNIEPNNDLTAKLTIVLHMDKEPFLGNPEKSKKERQAWREKVFESLNFQINGDIDQLKLRKVKIKGKRAQLQATYHLPIVLKPTIALRLYRFAVYRYELLIQPKALKLPSAKGGEMHVGMQDELRNNDLTFKIRKGLRSNFKILCKLQEESYSEYADQRTSLLVKLYYANNGWKAVIRSLVPFIALWVQIILSNFSTNIDDDTYAQVVAASVIALVISSNALIESTDLLENFMFAIQILLLVVMQLSRVEELLLYTPVVLVGLLLIMALVRLCAFFQIQEGILDSRGSLLKGQDGKLDVKSF